MSATAPPQKPGGACGAEDSSNSSIARMVKAAGDGDTASLLQLLGEYSAPACASSQALLYAASSGQTGTVRALVAECQADVEHTASNGWTATMYATRNGHTQCIVALVHEFGASPHRETDVGRTAIMYAASHGHMDAALALAEQCGANVLHEDSRRSNAIMYADAAGYASIAQALREASDCRALRKADARSTAPISAHEESSPQGPHRRDEYAPAPSPPTQSHEDPQSFTLPTTTPQNSPMS